MSKWYCDLHVSVSMKDKHCVSPMITSSDSFEIAEYVVLKVFCYFYAL